MVLQVMCDGKAGRSVACVTRERETVGFYCPYFKPIIVLPVNSCQKANVFTRFLLALTTESS